MSGSTVRLNVLKRIRKYEIQAEIGSGGFGHVYRAYDPDVGRLVAIKIMHPTSDRTVLVRFQNEATAAGRLHHKNIVTVYEFGESEGMAFLVMELLEGEDLQAVMRGGRQMSLFEKARIMRDVAEGLNAAHQSGITHRDVKPANVMVLPDGSAKIMDFGIARLAAGEYKPLTQQGFMLGTLQYMAPEQFLRASTDALTDIFAYGVIYYELIAGVHPFQGHSEPALLYNIMHREPEPVLSFAPNCPRAVAQIIHRAIQKDRDVRYQSMEDLLLDSQPAFLEIQLRLASDLLGEAQQLWQANDLEAALTRTRRVLELDPLNAQAKELRGTLLKEVRARALRPKIDELTRSGQEHLSARRFQEAVKDFETAAGMERSNSELQALVQRARTLLENSERVEVLLSQAQDALAQAKLSEAYESVSDALRLDPQNAAAQRLLDAVRAEMDRREQARRLQEGLSRARGFLLLRSWDEAIAELSELDEAHPDEAEIHSLLDRAREQKAAEDRQRRFDAGLSAVHDLMAKQSLQEAVQHAEALEREFPDQKVASEILAYARSELRVQQRAAAVAELHRDVQELTNRHEYDGALARIGEVQTSYPEEGQLKALSARIVRAKQAWERQRDIAEAERRSAELVGEARFEEALQTVDSALLRCPGEAVLTGAREKVIIAWERNKRAVAIDQVSRDAGRLLAARDFEPAIVVLEGAIPQYSAEQELGGLLRQAREALAAQRAEMVRAARAEAKQLAGRRDFEGAAGVLESALKKLPQHTELIEALEEVRRDRASWEREQALVAAVGRIRGLSGSGKFSEAMASADEAIRSLGADPRLLEAKRRAEAQAEEKKKLDFVSRAVEQARGMERAGRFEDAIQALGKALSKYPGEPKLTALVQEVEASLRARRAEAIDQACSKAASLRERHEFREAASVLEALLRSEPKEPRLLKALAEVRAAQESWQQEQAVAQAQARSTELAAQGHEEEAVRVLEAALSQYPGNAVLQAARKNAIAAWEQRRRSDEIAKVAAAARQLAEGHKFEDAISILQKAVRQHRAKAELDPVLAQIHELSARYRTETLDRICAEIAAAVSQHDFASAARTATSALKSWPREPRLLEEQQRVERERARWEHGQAVASAIGRARASREAGHGAEALRILEDASRQLGRDPALEEEKKRAEEDLERERRAEACRKITAAAQDQVRQRRWSEAVDLLRRGAREYPEQSEIGSLLATVEAQAQSVTAAIEEACRKAADLRQHSDFASALAILKQQLDQAPGDKRLLDALSETQAAEEQWRRQQAIADVERRANRLLELGDLDEAADLVEAGIYAREDALQDVQARIAAARQKRDRARAIERAAAKARESLEKGRFEEALHTLESAILVLSAESDLGGLLKQARDGKARQERAQGIERLRVEVEQLLERRDFDPAAARLQGGMRSWPDEPVLLELSRRSEQARANWEAEQARERQLAEEKRLKLSEAVQKCIAGGQPAQGVALVKQALAEKPGQPELTRLLLYAEEALQTHLRIERVENVRKQARAMMASQAYDRAAALLQQAVREFPNEPSLQRLMSQANTEWAAAKQKAAEASAASAPPGVDQTRAAEPTSEPPALQPPLLVPAPGAVAPMEEPAQQNASRPAAPAAIPTRLNQRKVWIGIGAAAAAGMVVGFLILRQVRTGGEVEIRSVPAGATVTVGQQSCTTPDCRLRLSPGTYELRAQLSGYEPFVKPIMVERRQANPIMVSLEPSPTETAIATNLESGRVRVNGGAASDLRGGQFSMRNLAAGDNRIEMEGEGARALVVLTITPGAAPAIASVQASGGANVLAIGALGQHANMRCQCDSEPATLDGKSVGNLAASEARLDNVVPGQHKVATKSSGLENDFVFSAGSRPSVQIFLRTGKNSGELLVEANEEGADVLLNGKRSGTTDDRGHLNISLPLQAYTVTVQKAGFQSPRAQRVTIRRGATEELKFQLTPLNPVLQLTDATPGARVLIDGTEKGVVSNDGRLSISAPPGTHEVEISRAGYRSSTIRHTFETGKTFALNGSAGQLVPEAPPPPDPNQVRAAEWARLQNSRDSRSLDDFRRKYPGTPEADQASRRIAQLAWDSVNQNDASALRAYVQLYPNSPNLPDAQRAIERLDQAKRAADEAKRLSDEQTKKLADEQAKKQQDEQAKKQQDEQAKKSADAAKNAHAAEVQAVSRALEAYQTAYARKDPAALQSIWPSIPKPMLDEVRNSFRNASEVSVALRPRGDPEISSNTATVICDRSVSQVIQRKALTASERVRVVLNRSGAGWVIQSIERVN